MKSCIITVIKNEHTCLEDFIKYHLKLGINHIFVFEDIDSESHSQICDKYDSVTLKPITDICCLDDRKGCKQWFYITEGISYIKVHYDYDWCFTLDVDEYITLENETDDINRLLDEYKDYIAIVLQGQNFNANGYVKKPDYSKNSITEIYTQKCGTAKNDFLTSSTKPVYNLHTFEKKVVFTQHLPIAKAHGCKPNFEKDKNVVYDRIYIRHYITKSGEEYVGKIKVRGMFFKKHRELEDFFHINPDLIGKKEILLKMAENIT